MAKTLIQKEVLTYRGNQYAITRPVEEPVKRAKQEQEQVSAVSSRMVDVSDIPPEMTTEMLTMFLENNSGGDIENVDYNDEHNTAVATFTDSVGTCKCVCSM